MSAIAKGQFLPGERTFERNDTKHDANDSIGGSSVTDNYTRRSALFCWAFYRSDKSSVYSAYWLPTCGTIKFSKMTSAIVILECRITMFGF